MYIYTLPVGLLLAYTPTTLDQLTPPRCSLCLWHVSLNLVDSPHNDRTYCHRIMRTFNFLLLAMLSCIAMIGAGSAAPIGNGAPAEAIERRESYVPLQRLMEVLIQLKLFSKEDNGPLRLTEDGIERNLPE